MNTQSTRHNQQPGAGGGQPEGGQPEGGQREPRVVITGMGWVTPLGHDLASVWEKLLAGTSGVSRIDRFDASTFATTFAAQVRDFDVTKFVDDPAVHANAGLNTQYALGAARQAWDQSRLDTCATLDRTRLGIYLGAGEGVLDFDNYARANLAGWDAERNVVDGARWYEAAFKHMQAAVEIEQEPNMPLAHIAREFGARGPASNCLTACAASTQAIGEASSIIRRGDADVMISGGAHTMIHVLGITGFIRLTALSNRNDEMQQASRPFDRTREGFVMGEGSGIVILESLEHAQARNATILAEIVGYGSSADAFRITDMHPEGRGPAQAIRQALNQAGIDPASRDAAGRPPVHYISAHGTGTKENDSIETLAVKTVFGENARDIPMSSIKSMMGHLIAAAGSVELIACVLAMQSNTLPPTINLREPDAELDLDYVPNTARPSRVDTAMSNSFGFGGQNDTLIVTRWNGS
ncbi:MAG: beta-ketoacyl-[acyl-carrier-protein] synthase family protein [Phycisphaerales bacterium]